MNTWDILLSVLIFAAFVRAGWKCIRGRKRGVSCCGNCAKCSGCSCHHGG